MISAQFPEHLAWSQPPASTFKYSFYWFYIYLLIWAFRFLSGELYVWWFNWILHDFYDFENSLHFSISVFSDVYDFENSLHFSISDFRIFTISKIAYTSRLVIFQNFTISKIAYTSRLVIVAI